MVTECAAGSPIPELPVMRCHCLLAAQLACGLLGWTLVQAQQPKPPAQPALPAINPAQARLDVTAGGLDGPGHAITFAEDSGLLIAGCEEHSLCYWEKDLSLGIRGSETPPHLVKAHQAPVISVVSAGVTLASAATDGKIILWHLPDEKVLHTLDAGTFLRCLALSPDGKQLASVGDDATVQLWDTATGKRGEKLTGSTDWLLCVVFSPDGKALAAGGHDGKLRVWEVAGGKKVVEVPAQAPPAAPNTPAPPATVITAVAYAPDGKSIAVGGQDTLVYHFQAADGKLLRTMPGHTSAISSLAFHPSGTLLASGSKDRQVRLWNPANGQLVKALEGHTAWVQGLIFLSQGTRLASVSADATVRIWDLTDPAKK
jgi:WD40 repeat protein